MPPTFPLFLVAVCFAALAPLVLLVILAALVTRRHRQLGIRALAVAGSAAGVVGVFVLLIGAIKASLQLNSLGSPLIFGAATFSAVAFAHTLLRWRNLQIAARGGA
jgi:hypothetical protein